MLAALGMPDVDLATWVKPRAKAAAAAANAAAGAGAAVEAEATTGSSSSLAPQAPLSLSSRDGLAGGSFALSLCLRLHADLKSSSRCTGAAERNRRPAPAQCWVEGPPSPRPFH